jgi:hypothetical protein
MNTKHWTGCLKVRTKRWSNLSDKCSVHFFSLSASEFTVTYFQCFYKVHIIAPVETITQIENKAVLSTSLAEILHSLQYTKFVILSLVLVHQ